MEPIQVYNAPPGTGPNPWKVIIILTELKIEYNIVWIPYSEIKSEPYVSLNPNGRLPSIIDPNTGVKLFESGAIVQYLVATYDKNLALTYAKDRMADKWLVDSWLMFQMSGQGPMFGQKMWFTHFHKESGITSVIERYGDETKRIVGVIEVHLQKRRQEQKLGTGDEVWLVGGKCTYADLAFVPWDLLLFARLFPEGFDVQKDFPEFHAWHQNLIKRPAVHKVVQMREESMRTMEDSAAAVLPKRA